MEENCILSIGDLTLDDEDEGKRRCFFVGCLWYTENIIAIHKQNEVRGQKKRVRDRDNEFAGCVF